MIETIFALITIAFAAALCGWWGTYDDLKKHKQWLREELTAHERTRQAARDAAARMRRENRERFLGLIEEQRAQ